MSWAVFSVYTAERCSINGLKDTRLSIASSTFCLSAFNYANFFFPVSSKWEKNKTKQNIQVQGSHKPQFRRIPINILANIMCWGLGVVTPNIDFCSELCAVLICAHIILRLINKGSSMTDADEENGTKKLACLIFTIITV